MIKHTNMPSMAQRSLQKTQLQSLLGHLANAEKTSRAQKPITFRVISDCSPQNLFNIGSAYLDLEKFEEAKARFDAALSMSPEMAVAWNRGLAEHSLMNLESAIDCFDMALLNDPNNIDAKWNKSHVLLTMGDYKAGFKLLKLGGKTQKFDSENVPLRANCGSDKVMFQEKCVVVCWGQFWRHSTLWVCKAFQ